MRHSDEQRSLVSECHTHNSLWSSLCWRMLSPIYNHERASTPYQRSHRKTDRRANHQVLVNNLHGFYFLGTNIFNYTPSSVAHGCRLLEHTFFGSHSENVNNSGELHETTEEKMCLFSVEMKTKSWCIESEPSEWINKYNQQEKWDTRRRHAHSSNRSSLARSRSTSDPMLQQ